MTSKAEKAGTGAPVMDSWLGAVAISKYYRQVSLANLQLTYNIPDCLYLC